MNVNTFTSVGSVYPTLDVRNVAAQTAALLGTTARMFRFTGSGLLAAVTVPLGTEVEGARGPTAPEVNQALSGNTYASAFRNFARPRFNSTSFDSGRPFRVRAMCTSDLVADGSTATTVVFNLYTGTSLTPGTNVVIANTGAAVSTAATKTSHLNALLEADLQWDSVTQTLAGLYRSSISGSNDTGVAATIHQVVAPAAMLNGPATAVTLALLSFGVGCTVGTTAGSAGSVSLVELSIEQL